MEAVQDQVPFNLVVAFAESILDGNEIYCNLVTTNKLRDINLSVPEGICAVGSYLRGLNEWVKSHQLISVHSIIISFVFRQVLRSHSCS